jgi:hypothetical protein
MLKINYVALGLAAIAWFVVGSLWYSSLLFGRQWMELSGMNPGTPAALMMPVWKVAAEFMKGLVVAYVLARLLAGSGATGWKPAVSLGIWLWIGFPLVILASSVMWQNVPWALAGIHAGDWLTKIVVMSFILGAWHN